MIRVTFKLTAENQQPRTNDESSRLAFAEVHSGGSFLAWCGRASDGVSSRSAFGTIAQDEVGGDGSAGHGRHEPATGDGDRHPGIAAGRIREIDAHLCIAGSCLTYLFHFASSSSLPDNVFHKYPLAEYAARSWDERVGGIRSGNGASRYRSESSSFLVMKSSATCGSNWKAMIIGGASLLQ